MRRGYKVYTTSNPFTNHRYDGVMAIIAGVLFVSVLVLSISWCLCII